MITVKNLCKNFGPIAAVNNVNFCISEGDVVALLGPNGAGKTTLMRMMTGFVEPTSGTIEIFGHDIRQERIRALQHIGYVPEFGFVYPDMRVYEFIKFCTELRGMKSHEFSNHLYETLETLEIKDVINQKIDNLSKGYKRRVGIAGAIINQPDILILDEPTEGLDPAQKTHLRRFIKEYGKNHLIIISTHIMEEVEAFANRVIFLNQGKLVKNTTPEELKALFPDNNIETAFIKITSEAGILE